MAAASKEQKLTGNNFIIVMLLISFLVVGVSGLIVKSLFTTIKRDMKVVTAKDKADKQLKIDLDAAPQLVAAYDSMGPQRLTLSNALPMTSDLPSLLVMLENMSGVGGVKLKTVTPARQATATDLTGGSATTKPGSGAPAPQAYTFNITFDGSLDNLKRFLDAIETSARPMRVLDVQFGGSGRALGSSIDIETYYQAKASLPLSKETIK